KTKGKKKKVAVGQSALEDASTVGDAGTEDAEPKKQSSSSKAKGATEKKQGLKSSTIDTLNQIPGLKTKTDEPKEEL
ncbi:MAG: hypothetical protein SGPRY_013727, partial [Prymnesium sp.]